MSPAEQNPPSKFRIEKLDLKLHDRSQFSCDSEVLNRWFREQAGQQTRSGVAVVYVLIEHATERIAGFYTLAAAGVKFESLPAKWIKAFRLPKYPELPALLLGRLAVDTAFAGKGLGRLLLVDAVIRAKETSDRVGCSALIVDAKDEAARQFYEKCGFQPLPTNPMRLFLGASAFADYVEFTRRD